MNKSIVERARKFVSDYGNNCCATGSQMNLSRALSQALLDAVEVLRDIGEQKTVDEVEKEADAEFDGDMEYAYEKMIEKARAFLRKVEGEK